MAAAIEDFLSEDGPEAFLVFFCYGYDAKASKEIEQITAYEKIYHKCFLYVTVCCIATAHHQ